MIETDLIQTVSGSAAESDVTLIAERLGTSGRVTGLVHLRHAAVVF